MSALDPLSSFLQRLPSAYFTQQLQQGAFRHGYEGSAAAHLERRNVTRSGRSLIE
ncbi:MAG TPA: hypothetical protein VHV80_14230 [Steroidobacteraceae bacterium]|nr:hypothetical protein [Steroidobacteraceae bacterium]